MVWLTRNLTNYMKFSIFAFCIFLLVLGCTNKPQKKESPQGTKESAGQVAENELSLQKEKIALLSKIKNVNYDTLFLLLKYYLVETDDYFLDDSISIVSNKTVDVLAKKYNLPVQKVASLIFSYKFEFQTKEEIIDEYQEDLDRANYEEQDNDPY